MSLLLLQLWLLLSHQWLRPPKTQLPLPALLLLLLRALPPWLLTLPKTQPLLLPPQPVLLLTLPKALQPPLLTLPKVLLMLPPRKLLKPPLLPRSLNSLFAKKKPPSGGFFHGAAVNLNGDPITAGFLGRHTKV